MVSRSTGENTCRAKTLVTLNDWSPLTLSDVVKLKAVFVRLAVQLPLMLPELLEFPQATSTTISARIAAIAKALTPYSLS